MRNTQAISRPLQHVCTQTHQALLIPLGAHHLFQHGLWCASMRGLISLRFPRQVTRSPVRQDPEQAHSSQLLHLVLSTRGLHARSVHEQLHELSLSTVYSLLAALMQALGLGSLCVAISMLKWVSVTLAPSYHLPRPWVTYNFGMPHHLDVYISENITVSTATRKLYFFDEDNEEVTAVMVTICFLGMFSGFAAFLLDFVELQMLGKLQMTLVTFLHILSGIFVIALLVICIWCLMKTKQQFKKDDWKDFPLRAVPGESFYITLMSFAFIVLAIVLSSWSMKLNRAAEKKHKKGTQQMRKKSLSASSHVQKPRK